MKQELCAALGDFDGVHIGHMAVIETAVKNCGNLIPTVYTFTQNCKNAKLITTNADKEKIILSLGVKKVIFDDFETIKSLSPLQFVKDVLVDTYNIKKIVCGKDFKFGKDAKGDINILKMLCDKHNISLVTVDSVDIGSHKVSSSNIRQAIQNGDMLTAKKLLGRNFSISGNVIHGKALGQKKNTPTVNLCFNDSSIIPDYGVYITKTLVDGKTYNSISNVGIRPSVESTQTPNIETHIFDFNDDVYEKTISIEFVKMIRRETKFENVEQLFKQIQDDISQAKLYFSEVSIEKIH